MWKSIQKIIPAANIHAKGSKFMLNSAASSVNPANYMKDGTERSDIFKLVIFANSLKRENQRLNKLCGNTTSSEAAKEAFRRQIEDNEDKLDSYVHQLERDFENQGDLPIDAMIGFVSVAAAGRTLTQEYFNTHLKAELLEKLEYASLEGLTELAEGLETLGFDGSSEISSAVHKALNEKVGNNSGYTYVDYSGNTLEQYSETKANSKQYWYGTVTTTQSCPIQSRVSKVASPSLYNHYKLLLKNLLTRDRIERIHEENRASDIQERAARILKGERPSEKN